jgi:hypothetical protein
MRSQRRNPDRVLTLVGAETVSRQGVSALLRRRRKRQLLVRPADCERLSIKGQRAASDDGRLFRDEPVVLDDLTQSAATSRDY